MLNVDIMSKQRRIKFLKISIIFLMIFPLKAQTTNIGEMVILTDTQVGIINNFNNFNKGNFLNDGELFIYADFNNNGTLDFVNEGMTRFQGNSVQQITGNSESFFYNIQFNNTSAAVPFQLSGQISINNESMFDQGIVDNDNFGGSITFQRLANHFNTSNDSHVDGSVIKIGDTAFEFPIGDKGFYRQAIINAPDIATDVYTGHYFLENSDPINSHSLTSGSIEKIDNTEYWIIKRSSGSSDVVLTLGWDTNTSPAFITNADPENLHIVRWDDNLGFWVDEGGIPDSDNQNVTTITTVSGYGIFTLATVKNSADGLVVYTGISPNGDGINDVFVIEGIENLENTLKIFNRWGVKVYDIDGYGKNDNFFRGISKGRTTIEEKDELPVGTYYYVLEYVLPTGERKNKAGYLYLNR